jgi:septal ring factor EnvC (AmiA/AmiB activator)
MADITELNKERQRLMQDFLQVKSDLAKAREEMAQLRNENNRLNVELEEREMAFQNLFSFVNEQS